MSEAVVDAIRATSHASEHCEREQHPEALAASLDQEVLANLRGLPGDADEDLLVELIDLFLQDVPARLVQLHGALVDGQAKLVMQIAHSLKGSSANLGARGMACICGKLEERGRAGSLDGGPGLYGELEHEFARVLRALELERNRTQTTC
jgi:HPt (histidine-containing phosphotransfer) domain-containing protein